jgi:hypothetical protein
MKKFLLLAGLVLVLGSAQNVFAIEGDDAIEKEDAASQADKDHPQWTQALKDKYSLTDAQIQTMKDKGISSPQMAMVAGLAAKSGKTIDEVLKMRTDDKMGWGKIAKTLGVHPGEIGKSVAELRHQVRDSRQEARSEKVAARAEAKEQRRQSKMERQQEKKAARGGKGHGQTH